MYGTNALLKRTILCIVVVLVGLVVMCNDVVLSPAVIAYYYSVTECMSDWEIFLITISFFSSLFYLQLPRYGLVLERLYFQVLSTCLTNRFTSLVCIQERKMLSGD